MTTINQTDSAGGTAAALAAAANSTKSLMGDTQERFLTLLVTQLQNQDPLNPMDNAQVTSQIAQLSTVNGINQLNNTLLALSGQMDVSQSMQAASLIGKEVLVPGSKVSLGSTGEGGAKVATPFGMDLISDATKVVVTITDNSGKAIRKMEMDATSSGVYSLSWDGKDDGGVAAPDGAYNVQVAAYDSAGAPVSVGALTYGKVSSVAYSSSGLQLDLGLAGSHSLLDIRKIM
ncbi:flagellar hook capping FlgD N-terminal domain-containing protein [Parapusillimonas granuli]|uniref:Basal-body rod modification protein FlgD n=1 Tax=Parapusillimonas granuli TaxID=380911 RepID=A0A853G1A9_9BURK|nr:flagellar basal-body rod modification protein FlgD [Parapusillimonas granuli]MEB2398497.1 flagellar hook assembly protein FlgD [Alcaligenaceae bacterium]NYT48236.1 flagellar hook assembly protein FlgD [Parapusillimonas granuli]